MLFCPKCGSLMKPKTEKGKTVFHCSCGYTNKKDVVNIEIKESIKQEDKEVEIVSEEEDDKVLPITEVECPKCKHQRAYYWLIQTRSGDEAETKFLKCEKCKHVWRDYS